MNETVEKKWSNEKLVSRAARFIQTVDFDRAVDENGQKTEKVIRRPHQKEGARGTFRNGVEVMFQADGSIRTLNKRLSRRKRQRLGLER